MIYLGTALFTSAEREYAAALTAQMESLGHRVYYPWRDAGDEALLREHAGDWDSVNTIIVERNLRAIERCRLMVAIVEGADADAGVAMEIGYAHALGKRLLLLRTDFRTQGHRVGSINIMLGVPAEALCRSVDALLDMLREELSHEAAACTVPQFYDRIAGEYGDAALHPTTHRFKRAEESLTDGQIQGRRFRAALDIGCGDGSFLCRVEADERIGVDCSVEMIRRHRERLPGASFLLTDCHRPLPLPDGHFDVVHCAFVLDHLTDVETCLSEIARVLASGGIALLALYAPAGSIIQDDGLLHYRTAAGEQLCVPRSFKHLADLPVRLARRFVLAEHRTLPDAGGELSLEYYVLRRPEA